MSESAGGGEADRRRAAWVAALARKELDGKRNSENTVAARGATFHGKAPREGERHYRLRMAKGKNTLPSPHLLDEPPLEAVGQVEAGLRAAERRARRGVRGKRARRAQDGATDGASGRPGKSACREPADDTGRLTAPGRGPG